MNTTKILILVSLAYLMTSCATVSQGPSPQMSIGAMLTDIEPVGSTPATQTQGGVTINLTPSSFDTVRSTACIYKRNEGALLFEYLLDAPTETHTRLQEEKLNILRVIPSKLTLSVTIQNQMERVFRGEGAVVQFLVDESIEDVEESQYLDLIEILIPPGGERQIQIQGPSVGALQEGSTISLKLFDVVTSIDQAGNILRRDNFEWNFRVQQATIRRTLSTIVSRENILYPNAIARSILESSLDDPSILPTRIIQPPENTVISTESLKKCYESTR